MNKTFNVLDAGIGAPDDGIQELTILNIHTGMVTFPENDGTTRDAEKVYLTCKTIDGERELIISEAWNETRRGLKKTQGLWVNLDNEQKLIANSTLGKLLSYHEVDTINDLTGKTVTGYPDEKGYTVLTTYDKKDESNNKSIFD